MVRTKATLIEYKLDNETLTNLLFWAALIAGIFVYQYTHPRHKTIPKDSEATESPEHSDAHHASRTSIATRATLRIVGIIIGAVFIFGVLANIAVSIWGASVISSPFFLVPCCVAAGLIFQRFTKR